MIFISFDSIVCRIMAVSEELEVGIRASIFVEKVVRASSRLSSRESVTPMLRRHRIQMLYRTSRNLSQPQHRQDVPKKFDSSWLLYLWSSRTQNLHQISEGINKPRLDEKKWIIVAVQLMHVQAYDRWWPNGCHSRLVKELAIGPKQEISDSVLPL